jgi:hypothetical protein
MTVNRDTVSVLRAGVERMLDGESDRAQSLNNRGTALAGFAAVTVGLVATVTKAGAGSTQHSVVLAFAITSLVLVGGAILLDLLAVVIPSPGKEIDIAAVEQFPMYKWVTQSPEMAEGYLLRGWVGSLRADRLRNDGKARALKWSVIFLTLGLLFLAAEGILIATTGTNNHASSRYEHRSRNPSPRAGPHELTVPRARLGTHRGRDRRR